MAVAEVMAQLKKDAGFDTACIVAVEAQLQRQRIRGGKTGAELRLRQKIGVFMYQLHRLLPVGTVELHGDLRRDMVC